MKKFIKSNNKKEDVVIVKDKIEAYKNIIKAENKSLQVKLDNIYKRLEYRSNGEYNKEQFENICMQVYNKINEAKKLIQEAFNIIG